MRRTLVIHLAGRVDMPRGYQERAGSGIGREETREEPRLCHDHWRFNGSLIRNTVQEERILLPSRPVELRTL